eukprot:2248933-Rhodomonas_salina.2
MHNQYRAARRHIAGVSTWLRPSQVMTGRERTRSGAVPAGTECTAGHRMPEVAVDGRDATSLKVGIADEKLSAVIWGGGGDGREVVVMKEGAREDGSV